MTTNLQPYPECKDSGLPWLGKVPGHWDLKCLGAITTRRSERNRPELPLLSVLREKGVVVRSSLTEEENRNFIPDDLTNYRVAYAGDLVVNKMKAWQGSVGIAPSDGIVSPAYFVFSLSGIENQYAHRLLRCRLYADSFARASDGVRIGQWDLSIDQMKRIPVPIPPPDEQDAIVRFLRSVDIKVNRFIRNRRHLIVVLSEQKQAIINRAVTRGLDPNAPLKPSGVEWMEDIPMHWEVRRLRNVAEMRVSNVDKHVKEGETPVRLCNYTDVYKNPVITANMPFMQATATAVEVDAFRLRVGDVIITKDSEEWQDIGVPALVAEAADDLICSYHLAILRPRASVASGRFLAYALQSRAATTQLSLAANGVTRYGLSHGAIKAISITVPPPDEQAYICEHIDAATASLNAAIRRAQREIDLIREYRTRLIADVVTGKVDVRGAVADVGKTQSKAPANIHFRRSVFAAEIVHRLYKESTFGHVKFEKLIFLCERKCGIDTGSTYYRQAAGPYDNRALRSIDSQLKKQKWYEGRKSDKAYRYIPLEKAGGHKEYFDRYFSDVMTQFNETIETLRSLDTKRCEIIATLYSAWEDMLVQDHITDDQIIEQVLHHWHPSKQQIGENRWRQALRWMKEKGFVPGAKANKHIETEYTDNELCIDGDDENEETEPVEEVGNDDN